MISTSPREGGVHAGGPPGFRESVRLLLAHFGSDTLLSNSFFIMATTATMGALGFGFWLLNARIFAASQVGVATTLISGTVLISYVSLLGFNSTFIRFLPASDDRDADINAGLILVFGAAVVLAAAYIVAVPSLVPALRFVRDSLPDAGAFVALTAFTAVNLVTDSVFIAYRAAKYNFIVDGLIQGVTKLALPLALIGLGAYGIFAASGLAAVLAVVFSLVFMIRRFSYRPAFRVSAAVLRRVFAFSALNYLANLLNIVPTLLLPLIVIYGRGPAQAGYFYVGFQLANLTYSASYAFAQSLFAEGSYAGVDLARLARRSAKVLALLAVPAVGLLVLGSHWLLLVFGDGYSRHATAAVAIFGLAVPALALNVWTTSLLRLTKQLWALVWSNVAYVVVLCGLAAAWVHKGLGWVATAWLLGNLISGIVGGLALVARIRRLRYRPRRAVRARPARPRHAVGAGLQGKEH